MVGGCTGIAPITSICSAAPTKLNRGKKGVTEGDPSARPFRQGVGLDPTDLPMGCVVEDRDGVANYMSRHLGTACGKHKTMRGLGKGRGKQAEERSITSLCIIVTAKGGRRKQLFKTTDRGTAIGQQEHYTGSREELAVT